MIDSNFCLEDGCSGKGSPEHIRHALADKTVTQLICAILLCCADNLSTLRSCMCCHYAREIGRRGTPEGFDIQQHKFKKEK